MKQSHGMSERIISCSFSWVRSVQGVRCAMTGCQRSIIMTAELEAFAFAVESRCNGKTWWPGQSVTTALLLHLVTATDRRQKWVVNDGRALASFSRRILMADSGPDDRRAERIDDV